MGLNTAPIPMVLVSQFLPQEINIAHSRTSDSEQCEEVQWAVMSCQAATYLGKIPALLPSYQAIPPRGTPK